MKSIRSNENDLQMIEEICKNNKVSSKALRERVEKEMTHVIGDADRLQIGYDTCIEAAEKLEKRIILKL